MLEDDWNYQPARGCAKTRHESKAAAINTLNQMKKRGKIRKKNVNKEQRIEPYHCTYCGGWHLGNRR